MEFKPSRPTTLAANSCEHHASAGNLDERGVGRHLATLTVDEYHALSPAKETGYRFYRHPVVMFGIGPVWVFLLKQRLPVGMMRAEFLPWVSTMATNLAVAPLVAALTIWFVGLVPFLLVHLPVCFIGGSCRRLAVLRTTPV